jgi:hypothetical protein
MTTVSAIRTLALQGSTIVDVSLSMQVVQQDHVWLLGDDASTIAAVAAELKILAGVIDAGYRDDLEIRTEATRLVRILERRAARDLDAGLLDVDPAQVMALLHPDAYDDLGDMEPIPIDTYVVTPQEIEKGVSSTGAAFVRVQVAATAG